MNYLYGIYVNDSTNSKVESNIIVNNGYWGIYLKYSHNTSVTGNTLNSNRQGMRLEDSSNNTISKNSVDTYDDQGINIYHNSPYNRVLNNTISGGASYSGNIGISLDWADHTIVMGNNVTNNRGRGISISGNSQHVVVDHNNVNNNSGYAGCGITITSSNNIVTNNTIIFNDLGVCLFNYRRSNIISNNIIENNNEVGIDLFAMDDTLIFNNSIKNNGGYGIKIFEYSKNNNISNNIVCQNSISDFLVDVNATENYGDNNTCYSPDGWNDNGTTGCTFICELPPKPPVAVVPTLTPVGLIALVGLLSAIAAVTITSRKRR